MSASGAQAIKGRDEHGHSDRTRCVADYAAWIEPNWIDVNIYDMRSDQASAGIRIVQLSDLHLQDLSRRELEVANRIKTLKPDLVILSGDVIDRGDRLATLHAFLAALGDTPIVAVLGNWESGPTLIFMRYATSIDTTGYRFC